MSKFHHDVFNSALQAVRNRYHLVAYYRMIFDQHTNWDSSRANFLSKTEQNSNIYKGFLSKAGQNSNSQTGNHTPLQEHAHTSTLALHCSDES